MSPATGHTSLSRRTAVVTAPYRQLASSAGRRPWGQRHAYIEESSKSACGRPTVNWHVFWNIPFVASDTEACEECVRVIGGGIPPTMRLVC